MNPGWQSQPVLSLFTLESSRHVVHTVCPLALENVQGAHSGHDTVSSVSENVPGSHIAQTAAPACSYLPLHRHASYCEEAEGACESLRQATQPSLPERSL